MVEQQPSKLMTRVRFPSPAVDSRETRVECQEPEGNDFALSVLALDSGLSTLNFAAVAQLVEHFLGKEEVMSSSLISSSWCETLRQGRLSHPCYFG
jgi:hypothetical protein